MWDGRDRAGIQNYGFVDHNDHEDEDDDDDDTEEEEEEEKDLTWLTVQCTMDSNSQASSTKSWYLWNVTSRYISMVAKSRDEGPRTLYNCYYV